MQSNTMNEKLSFQNIADLIVQKADVPKKTADTFAKAFFDTITDTLVAGEETVKVKGLGKYDFDVAYKNNLKIGKATVVVTGVDDYKGKIVKHFRITKRTNSFKLKSKKKTVRAASLKKRAKTFRVKSLMPAKGAKGKVTYKVKIGGKAGKAVSFRAGKIKVRKGAKKGVYKVKVTAKAAGNKTYKRGSRTATLTIKIK